MTENEELGKRIEFRRKALNLTLSDVAAEVGVAASTIQRYEKGHFDKIKLPVIEAIALALSVSPDWIAGYTNDPIDYEDGDLIASIPQSYIELFDGDIQKAYRYMLAVDDENLGRKEKESKKSALSDSDIKAAFWGGEKDLSDAEIEALWQDVKDYAKFKTEQKKKKESNGSN